MIKREDVIIDPNDKRVEKLIGKEVFMGHSFSELNNEDASPKHFFKISERSSMFIDKNGRCYTMIAPVPAKENKDVLPGFKTCYVSQGFRIVDSKKNIRISDNNIIFKKSFQQSLGVKIGDHLNILFNEKTEQYMLQFCNDGCFALRKISNNVGIHSIKMSTEMASILSKYPETELLDEKTILLTKEN